MMLTCLLIFRGRPTIHPIAGLNCLPQNSNTPSRFERDFRINGVRVHHTAEVILLRLTTASVVQILRTEEQRLKVLEQK